jgi:hypothetical protein
VPDAAWILAQSRLPQLRLDLDVPVDRIREEVLPLRDRFISRTDPQKGATYQYLTRATGWSCLVVHGLSVEQVGHCTQYGYQNDAAAPYGWTEISGQCPVTVDFLKAFPCKKLYRCRFLLLTPGGKISLHQDTSTPSFDRISIAIQYPEGCVFEVDGKPVPFEDGRAFLIDKSYLHQVDNPTSRDRIHLIVECDLDDPRWRELVERSYDKYAG